MRLFSTLYYDAEELLPWFLAYYRKLGITSFHFIVQLYENPRLLESVEGFKKSYPIELQEVMDDYVTGAEVQVRMSGIRSKIVAGSEWALVADPDEFQVYDRPMCAVVEACERERACYVQGRLVDRVANDGSLPPLVSGQPLNEQFPLRGNLTGPLLQGATTKVTLVRGSTPTGPGQHAVLGAHRRFSQPCVEVHHFKWRAGLSEKLRRRVEERRARGNQWWQPSQYFLDHLAARGRIDVDDKRFGFRRSETPLDLSPDVIGGDASLARRELFDSNGQGS
jgi:hypothetical protein